MRVKQLLVKYTFLVVLSVLTFYNVEAQQVKIFKNLNAGGETVYFSFSEDKQVKPTDAWDLSFNRTTISVNAKASAQITDGDFAKIASAPKDGYKNDNNKGNAIPSGSGNGWYKYNMMGHTITPLPSKVIFVKTTSGKVVKVEILNYNKDQSEDGETGYYSFQYAFID